MTIQSEVTDDYKSYLDAKEDGWESKLLEAGEDDTSAKMNAHMGLALIRFAWAQVEGDAMITDLDPIVIEIDDQITNLASFIEDEVIPDISELKFIDLFFSETFDPDYYDFSDSLFSLMETLVNKIDLLEEDSEAARKEKELYFELIKAYEAVDITVISLAALKGQGLLELKEIMRNQASVFSGQSGVGKTSLINQVTGLDLRVGETVERTKKGSHTTTSTRLIPLESGGWCIDTPGIKSFGVWDLKINEIERYFTEIHQCGLKCKFPNCTHTHESDCAVLQAVTAGELSAVRYDSYQSLVTSLSEQHVRR